MEAITSTMGEALEDVVDTAKAVAAVIGDNVKEAVEQYGSSDSGASLGDILGAALIGNDDLGIATRRLETMRPRCDSTTTCQSTPFIDS